MPPYDMLAAWSDKRKLIPKNTSAFICTCRRWRALAGEDPTTEQLEAAILVRLFRDILIMLLTLQFPLILGALTPQDKTLGLHAFEHQAYTAQGSLSVTATAHNLRHLRLRV